MEISICAICAVTVLACYNNDMIFGEYLSTLGRKLWQPIMLFVTIYFHVFSCRTLCEVL